MKTDTAVKIIIVLLVIMIASVVGLLLIVNNEQKPLPGPVTTEADKSTESPSTGEPSTQSPVTGAPSTQSPVTEPPATQPPESGETEPPVTQPPVSSENPGGTVDISETYTTDTGTALNMKAKINAMTSESGKVTVSIEVVLEHYSMSVRARNGSLIIGDRLVPFYVDELRIPDNVYAETLLFTFEDEFEYGETLDIFIEYPYGGKYGGIEIDELAITASVILK